MSSSIPIPNPNASPEFNAVVAKPRRKAASRLNADSNGGDAVYTPSRSARKVKSAVSLRNSPVVDGGIVTTVNKRPDGVPLKDNYVELENNSSKKAKSKPWGRVFSYRKIIFNAILGLLLCYVAFMATGFLQRLVSQKFKKKNEIEDFATNEIFNLQKKIFSLDNHVKNILPKILLQLEVAHKRVDKLQDSHESLESKTEESLKKLIEEVGSLTSRHERMDATLQDVVGNDLHFMKAELSRIESRLIEEKTENEASLQSSFTLEDVRVVVREMLSEEMARHVADDIGKPDYALASVGGRVLRHTETVNTTMRRVDKISGYFRPSPLHPHASRILERTDGTPGHCLPLKGDSGAVDIALRTAIHISEVTLEHVPQSVALDSSSAPKLFRVLGMREGGLDPLAPEILGEFTYGLEGSHIQSFSIAGAPSPEPFNAVRLEVLSNHGSKSHTCIYRLRVHGIPSSL